MQSLALTAKPFGVSENSQLRDHRDSSRQREQSRPSSSRGSRVCSPSSSRTDLAMPWSGLNSQSSSSYISRAFSILVCSNRELSIKSIYSPAGRLDWGYWLFLRGWEHTVCDWNISDETRFGKNKDLYKLHNVSLFLGKREHGYIMNTTLTF